MAKIITATHPEYFTQVPKLRRGNTDVKWAAKGDGQTSYQIYPPVRTFTLSNLSIKPVGTTRLWTADVTVDSYSGCKGNPNFTNGVKYPIYQPNVFSITYAYSYYYAYWAQYGLNSVPDFTTPKLWPSSGSSYYGDWRTITIPRTSNQNSTQFCYILNSKLYLADDTYLPMTAEFFDGDQRSANAGGWVSNVPHVSSGVVVADRTGNSYYPFAKCVYFNTVNNTNKNTYHLSSTNLYNFNSSYTSWRYNIGNYMKQRLYGEVTEWEWECLEYRVYTVSGSNSFTTTRYNNLSVPGLISLGTVQVYYEAGSNYVPQFCKFVAVAGNYGGFHIEKNSQADGGSDWHGMRNDTFTNAWQYSAGTGTSNNGRSYVRMPNIWIDWYNYPNNIVSISNAGAHFTAPVYSAFNPRFGCKYVWIDTNENRYCWFNYSGHEVGTATVSNNFLGSPIINRWNEITIWCAFWAQSKINNSGTNYAICGYVPVVTLTFYVVPRWHKYSVNKY